MTNEVTLDDRAAHILAHIIHHGYVPVDEMLSCFHIWNYTMEELGINWKDIKCVVDRYLDKKRRLNELKTMEKIELSYMSIDIPGSYADLADKQRTIEIEELEEQLKNYNL